MCHEKDFVFLKAFLGILSYKNIVINYYNITYRTEKDIPQNLIDGMVVSDFYVENNTIYINAIDLMTYLFVRKERWK
jgi:hypothetical protein